MSVNIQHTHVQNHVYTNKSRHTHIHSVCQLPNPVTVQDIDKNV